MFGLYFRAYPPYLTCKSDKFCRGSVNRGQTVRDLYYFVTSTPCDQRRDYRGRFNIINSRLQKVAAKEAN